MGCPAIGGADPDPSAAPNGAPKSLPSQPTIRAAGIAFYRAMDGPGVFAPRGWHCRTWHGSNGAFIIVTPTAPPETIPRESVKGQGAMAIESQGGTSGRFDVAEVSARIFPVVMADFIARIKAEGFPSPDFSKIKPYRVACQKPVDWTPFCSYGPASIKKLRRRKGVARDTEHCAQKWGSPGQFYPLTWTNTSAGRERSATTSVSIPYPVSAEGLASSLEASMRARTRIRRSRSLRGVVSPCPLRNRIIPVVVNRLGRRCGHLRCIGTRWCSGRSSVAGRSARGRSLTRMAM